MADCQDSKCHRSDYRRTKRAVDLSEGLREQNWTFCVTIALRRTFCAAADEKEQQREKKESQKRSVAAEADGGEDGFGEAEKEKDVAHGIEAPNPPFQDDPEHQDDAAEKGSPTGPRMFLEQHPGS